MITILRLEQRLGAFDNFKTDIDGVEIHFIHSAAAHRATPLRSPRWRVSSGIPRHSRCTNRSTSTAGHPTTHSCGTTCPPQFGFRQTRGYGHGRSNRHPRETLMGRNYSEFRSRRWLELSLPSNPPEKPCRRALHATIVLPDETTLADPQPAELDALESFQFYNDWDSGYSKQQSTRPQTLGYGLADSPSGQMAWIVEKFAFWMDCERNGIRHPENVLSKDQLLDNVMLYWTTNSAASSARLLGVFGTLMNPITRPMGLSVFLKKRAQANVS